MRGSRLAILLVFFVSVIAAPRILGQAGSGTLWAELFPSTTPPSRWSGDLVYDTRRDLLVMFGGISDDQPFQNDTWEWNGVDWVLRTPATAPGPRRDNVIVYDSLRERTYVISGLGFDPQTFDFFRYDDMWAWDGDAWSEITTATRPAPRILSSAVFDESRGEVVLFGGRCEGGFECNDTWTFDGTSWTERTPLTSPSPREAHAMVYDSQRQRVVLFGGSGMGLLGDTWEWDGTNWTQVATPVAPPARQFAAAAFDTSSGRTVLFGGLGATGVLGDTWVFNGSRWTELAGTAPPQRLGALLEFRPADGIVAFGGLDNTDDASRINHSDTWRLILPTDTTPPTLTCTGPSRFLLNGTSRVAATVVDEPGGSGAENDQVSVPADTRTVGFKTIDLEGSDNAGNVARVTCGYLVTYKFTGFGPLASTKITTARAGQTIPLFWFLRDASGAPVRNLPMASLTVWNVDCTTGATTMPIEVDVPDDRARRLGLGFYMLNWKTLKRYEGSCRIVKLDLGEGITHDAIFRFVDRSRGRNGDDDDDDDDEREGRGRGWR